jgi:predicted helicase
MDWPGRSGADVGIDLVACDLEGHLIAIQCTCYAPTATLTEEAIDSFAALSGQLAPDSSDAASAQPA